MLRQLAAFLASAALIAPLGCGSGTKTARPADPAAQRAPAAGDPQRVTSIPAVAVDPGTEPGTGPQQAGTAKPLSDTVKRGLTWLAGSQLQSGGWGQGDEAPQLRPNEPAVGIANVADTSMALLAFVRAGHTPRVGGEHARTVDRGLGFVLSQIEESDSDSLYVSPVRGTRVQAKIGQYVDTFAALMLLTEAKGQMRDPAANARLDAALKKTIRKVERNQRDNGSWDDNGWAPVLSQALAAKGLNRAAQSGATVSKQALERVEAQAKSGDMKVRASAGIGLYGDAASTANIRDDAETKKAKASALKAKAKQAPAPVAQSPDVPTKAQIDAADAEAAAATKAALDSERALTARLSDQGFVAGFGNNGGEEFLSYLLISETLVQNGGTEWQRWDSAITQLVGKVQNEDGSWVGHHCITGRTFVTASALLVLLGDRAPKTHNLMAK
ncbi:MAG TPA: prenyltransferase/squalene oxidase repeat-containing protein [Kofleriaceae bacterium]|nr:prenyltransferase/squalene oxidase repeat-containing protein [Kofleriaceae bacterium]